MKTLIIVESPTKAKTIAKFLGSEYKVESSFGHVRDLPEKKLGIAVEHRFTPEYVIPTKARPVVKKLKEAVGKADETILATDEDREGEAIAWHLATALKLSDPKRIVFHEITQSAIQNSLRHPRPLNLNLVYAQQARRVLDRLVGYKLSPFLWKKVAKGLSAGRVQSVTLRLIVEREQEIRNFKAQEYWTIVAHLTTPSGDIIEATLAKRNGEALDKFAIPTKEAAEAIVRDLESASYRITAVEQKDMRRNPGPPFTTSTLQQEAAKRLGFSSKRTMMLAQRLYENGFITYMRTDSVNLSQESLGAAKTFITGAFGESYAAQAPRTFQTKSKMAQEAHEAVRPTQPSLAPDQFQGDEGEKKLYRLIWNRFIASQMPQAVFAVTGATITAGAYELRATGTTLRFDGYLKVWPQKFEEKQLPPLHEGEALTREKVLPEQHFTEPPARYSEATLIKALEEKGIGRPSTYAPTISVIQTRNYVVKEERRFRPTEMGELVNGVLTEHFPEVVDVNFTAKMEDTLDAVAEGAEAWQDVLEAFYVPFDRRLHEKYQEVTKQSVVPETTDQVCEKCGKPMVVRMSRFGKFLACSGFPECRNTKSLAGPGTQQGPKTIGMKCPTCKEGEVVERFTRRGRKKVFWGCSRYPKCEYATWTDPRQPAEAAPPPEEKS